MEWPSIVAFSNFCEWENGYLVCTNVREFEVILHYLLYVSLKKRNFACNLHTVKLKGVILGQNVALFIPT